MDDHVFQALMEAGWDETRLNRRLALFQMKARGLTMQQCHGQLIKDGFDEVTERSLWNDWAKIRELMAKASAPVVSEIRDRASARLEQLFNLAMGQIARDLDPDPETGRPRGRVQPPMIETARRIVALQAELFGAIDRHGALVAINPGQSPLEVYEQRNNGDGPRRGPFTAALGRSSEKQVDSND